MFRENKDDSASRQSRGGRMTLANRQMQIRMSMRAGGSAGVGKSLLPGGGSKAGGPAKYTSWVDNLNEGDVVWVNLAKTSYAPRWVHAVAKSRERKMIALELSDAYMEDGDEKLEKPMKVKVSDLKKIAAPGNTTELAVIQDGNYTKSKILVKGAAAEAGFADDMIQLNAINEPAIIHLLEGRARIQNVDETREKCFTYIANVLIAVNPCFNPDKKLVDPDHMSIVGASECIPHPYAVAETAFQQMASVTKESIKDQSIVINGESGSGKTESFKLVLRHLLFRDNATSNLEKGIIQSNPVLEAFGNAKTKRTNNSSCFVKFIKLEFTRASPKVEPVLSSGMIETYLLEKSRLVTAINSERNFHIFYQLLSDPGLAATGADTQLSGRREDDFFFLNQNECLAAVGVNDGEEFEMVKEGLSTVGMNEDQQKGLFQLLSGILYLGNIKFEDLSMRDGSEKAEVSEATKHDAQQACSMLGVAPSDGGNAFETMRKIITERSIKSASETIVVQKDATASDFSRKAVCKELYGRIFDWIVSTINASFRVREAPVGGSNTFIGVLDVIGFKCFPHNDFEQLLINYTNEVLQALFNQQVFAEETKLYRVEGLYVPPVQWDDNKECVELIASEKPPGILMLLHNEMQTQKPSDIKFCKELHRQHGYNPFCPKPHPKDIQRTFIVKHFAGKVQYSIGSFIEKNNNSVPAEIMSLFQQSRLANLCPELVRDPAAEVAAAAEKRRRKKKLLTVGILYQKQMASLIETLQATRCSFIRCLNPNAAATFGVFDRSYVQAQVRMQGLPKMCEMLQSDFPTRVSYERIAARFRGPTGLPEQVQKLFEAVSEKAFVQAIVWAFGLDTQDFKLGPTRIFFRARKRGELQKLLDVDMTSREGKEITARLLSLHDNDTTNEVQQKWLTIRKQAAEAHRLQIAHLKQQERELAEKLVKERDKLKAAQETARKASEKKRLAEEEARTAEDVLQASERKARAEYGSDSIRVRLDQNYGEKILGEDGKDDPEKKQRYIAQAIDALAKEMPDVPKCCLSIDPKSFLEGSVSFAVEVKDAIAPRPLLGHAMDQYGEKGKMMAQELINEAQEVKPFLKECLFQESDVEDYFQKLKAAGLSDRLDELLPITDEQLKEIQIDSQIHRRRLQRELRNRTIMWEGQETLALSFKVFKGRVSTAEAELQKTKGGHETVLAASGLEVLKEGHAAAAKAEKERKRREAEEQAEGQGDLIGGALDDDDDDDDSSDDDDEAADQRMYLVDSYRLCGVATTMADGTEASMEELEANARRQFQAQTDQQFKAMQSGGTVRASMAVEAGISRKGGKHQQEQMVGGVDYSASTPLAGKMQQLNRMKELEWVTNKEYTKLAARIYGDEGGEEPFPPLPTNPKYKAGGGTAATANSWDMRGLKKEYEEMHTLRMQQKQNNEQNVDEWVSSLAVPELLQALREAGMDVDGIPPEEAADAAKLQQRLRFIHAPHDNEDLRWHVSQLECPYCERLNSTLRMADGHRCRYCGEDVFSPDVVYIGAQNEYEPDHESYAAEGIRRALLTNDIRLKKFLAMDGMELDEGTPPPPPGLAGKYTSEPSILAERLNGQQQQHHDASGGWGDTIERLNGKPYFVQTESEETGDYGFFIGWSGESREAAVGHQIKLVTVVDDGSGARFEDDIHGCVGRLLEAVDELDDMRTYEVEVQVWDEWFEGQPPPEARIKLLKLEGSMLKEREMGHWVVAEIEALDGLLVQAAQGVAGMRFNGLASSEGLMNPYIPAAIENSHWAQFTVEPEEEGMPSVPYEGGQLQISIYGSMEDVDSDPNSPTYGHKVTEYVLLCRWGSGDEPITPNRSEYCEHWLVAAGIKEFQDFHNNFRRQIKPVMPQGLRMPKFVARLAKSDEDHEAETNKAKRLKRREEAEQEQMKALLGYWKELFEMLTVHSSLCNHIEALDKFLALNARIKEIKQTRSWQNETEETSDVVAPYGTREDLVNNCQKPIDMLERVLMDNQGDVRKSPGVQSLVRACLAQRQKLQATATSGPFTEPDLIPEAELLLEQLVSLLRFYNEEAMSAQTGILGLVNNTGTINNVEMAWNQGE